MYDKQLFVALGNMHGLRLLTFKENETFSLPTNLAIFYFLRDNRSLVEINNVPSYPTHWPHNQPSFLQFLFKSLEGRTQLQSLTFSFQETDRLFEDVNSAQSERKKCFSAVEQEAYVKLIAAIASLKQIYMFFSCPSQASREMYCQQPASCLTKPAVRQLHLDASCLDRNSLESLHSDAGAALRTVSFRNVTHQNVDSLDSLTSIIEKSKYLTELIIYVDAALAAAQPGIANSDADCREALERYRNATRACKTMRSVKFALGGH